MFNNNDYFSLSSLSKLGSKHDKNNFFVLHLNTRSLTKNHDKIEELLNELNFFPEIISISETKLNPQKTININICNYDFIHNDSPTNAGGVGLYVKNGLKYSIRNDLNLHLPYCEDIWIEVKSTKQSLILSTIYRHPNSVVANFQDKLCDILLKLENNKTSNVINGDFNINLLNTKNNKVKNYTNMLTSVGCNSLINSPTRYSSNCTPSLLDHIYTNISNLRKTSGICLYDISHHLPTFLNIDNFQHSIKNKTVYRRSMKHFNLEHFIADLQEHLQNIDVANPISNVNNDSKQLISAFEFLLNKHSPLQPLSRQEKRLNEKPWISKCILKSIRTKNKLFRSHYRSNDLNKKLFYKKYLNKLTHIKYLAKQSYYKNLFKESEGDSYRTWSIIGELIDYKNKKCASKIPCTIEVNDKMLKTKSVDFLNELCKYFANVGANMNKNLNSIDSKLTIHAKCCSQSFVFHEITVEEINSCINNLKNRSAPGLDGINPKFIKMSKVCLAPFLATFFNKCIAQSVFPENFKTAIVTPIPKTTTPRSMNDFRPISLLPILSKIFEKIIAKK